MCFRFQLEDFGWSSLVGIDVNAENFCGAGIINTSTQPIGCLYRLEPNKQAKVNISVSFRILVHFVDDLDVPFNHSDKQRRCC